MASSTAIDLHVPYEESRSHTNFKVAKLSHTWTISNFSFVEQKVGCFLMSGTFPLRCHEENTNEWFLKIYPKGETEEYKGFVSIYLCCQPTGRSKIKAQFKIGFIDAKGERSAVRSSTKIWQIEIKKGAGRGWAKFVGQDYLLNKENGLMQDDNLVVFCEVEVFTDISNRSEKVNEIQFTELNYHPLENIEHLFETKQFSDVTLNAGGKEFEAHKIILAAQSPVFAAMFTNDMEEKKESRIDITDMDDEVVKDMLCFLYTGRVKNSQKTAPGLLAAAEKYALGRMKSMCEETLRTSLTIENAADTLILADLHRADQLKSQVIKFICFYATEVMTTAGFKKMLLSHPNLIAEAFCELAQKTNGNSCKESGNNTTHSSL